MNLKITDIRDAAKLLLELSELIEDSSFSDPWYYESQRLIRVMNARPDMIDLVVARIRNKLKETDRYRKKD